MRRLHMNTEEIIQSFIKYATIHDETQHSGNFRKGNKSADLLFALSDQIHADNDNGPEIIDQLLEQKNPGVLIWASGLAIEMNYRKKDAIHILKDLSSNQELGIQRHNAEMSLTEYKKKRY
jgi:hypothetical protein